jgi:hypothetical protein
MGSEAKCTAKVGRKVSKGKALLETEALLFRGDFRLSIPYKDLKSVEAKDGTLRLTYSEGTAVFELGPLAEKWASKILNPKSLLDKLGVKVGARVAVLGVADEYFRRQLRERTGDFTEGRPEGGSDFIFLRAETKTDLKRLAALQDYLKPQGAIWVVWAKGQPHLKESDVMIASKEAGLVDVKVAKFSETHSALKLVIPVARRITRTEKRS